jgi:hypothetical protein
MRYTRVKNLAHINPQRMNAPSGSCSEHRSCFFILIGLITLVGLVACNEPVKTTNQPDSTVTEMLADQGDGVRCEPDCEGRECGVDPRCGLSCGECTANQVCESAVCLSNEELGAQLSGGEEQAGIDQSQGGANGTNDCTPSCESASAQCGELCGMSCGTCSEGERCEDNHCICLPQCAGKSCGDDDGCGGQCTPCPRSESCETCALRLRVLSTSEVGGQVSAVQVALSLQLPEGAPHPQIADIHLMMTGPAILGRVGLAEALINANKQLIPDPATGMPYRVNGSTYSFMVLSTQNTHEIPTGDWLILDIQLGNTNAQPVQLKVVEREQTFAPPAADLQLWGASLGEGLVIWPALSQGE